VLVGVNVLLTLLARIELSLLLPIFRALLLFGVVILAFQLLFQEGDRFLDFGPVGLHTEGFFITARVWLRLANLSLLFVGFMMWTHPTDIALMWVGFRVPYRYALLGGLALRFFPILQNEVVRIQDAQQVRGQPLHRTWQRIKGLTTILLPFVLGALRRTTQIALAMELRGFGYAEKRTFLRTIGMRPVDWCLAVVVMLLVALRLLLLAGYA
jgi:energy-coupling factor transport system permease protein